MRATLDPDLVKRLRQATETEYPFTAMFAIIDGG
jgi:hypothetical protein